MMNFGLRLVDGNATLVDMDSCEIIAEDRYSIWAWLNAYENNYTLILI